MFILLYLMIILTCTFIPLHFKKKFVSFYHLLPNLILPVSQNTKGPWELPNCQASGTFFEFVKISESENQIFIFCSITINIFRLHKHIKCLLNSKYPIFIGHLNPWIKIQQKAFFIQLSLTILTVVSCQIIVNIAFIVLHQSPIQTRPLNLADVEEFIFYTPLPGLLINMKRTDTLNSASIYCGDHGNTFQQITLDLPPTPIRA